MAAKLPLLSGTSPETKQQAQQLHLHFLLLQYRSFRDTRVGTLFAKSPKQPQRDLCHTTFANSGADGPIEGPSPKTGIEMCLFSSVTGYLLQQRDNLICLAYINGREI
jgi:hypothetical protein